MIFWPKNKQVSEGFCSKDFLIFRYGSFFVIWVTGGIHESFKKKLLRVGPNIILSSETTEIAPKQKRNVVRNVRNRSEMIEIAPKNQKSLRKELPRSQQSSPYRRSHHNSPSSPSPHWCIRECVHHERHLLFGRIIFQRINIIACHHARRRRRQTVVPFSRNASPEVWAAASPASSRTLSTW